MSKANRKLEKEVEAVLKKIWERTTYRCLCCGAEKRMGGTMNHDEGCIYQNEQSCEHRS